MLGLDGVVHNDLMDNIEWFFNIHDKDKDGFLTKDEVLTLSETFLVSFVSHLHLHFPSLSNPTGTRDM